MCNCSGISRSSDCSLVSQTADSLYHYWCPNTIYELLLMESLDADTETRRLSPVAIIQNGYVDLVNGPQDHGWCSGYTCQKRVSLFHANIRVGKS